MVRKLKHTEIGDIPVDWELQTFDETFRVLSNNTLSRENLNNRSGVVRNIHYGDILTKFPEVLDCNEEEISYVNDLSLLSSSTQLLRDGDIVVADTAEDETVGKVTEVQNLGDSKLVAGLHTIPCRVKKGDFAPGWLGYYMNCDLFHNQILPYITGIKVSSISKGAISDTLILVPPFDEQEKIVQSLNEVQLLMTAETKVVNKIKFVKNGCLSKMFPQKDDTVPEMRLPGFTVPWEQRKLGELLQTLPFKQFLKEPEPDGKYEIIQQGNEPVVGFANGAPCNDYKDTVIFGDHTLSLYKPKRPFFVATDGVRIVKGKRNTDGHYLLSLLERYKPQSEGYKRYYSILVDVECFTTYNVSEQKQLGAYFDTLDNLITLHQRKCDKYSNIKKGMMSDLFTGKIRLV